MEDLYYLGVGVLFGVGVVFAVAAVLAIYRRIAAPRRQAPLNLHDALDRLRDAVARRESRDVVFFIIFDCAQFGANAEQVSGAIAAGRKLAEGAA